MEVSGYPPPVPKGRGPNWQPPRSFSSPYLELAASRPEDRPRKGFKQAGAAPHAWAVDGVFKIDPGALSGEASEPELAGRPSERVKEECRRLRLELADRGGEARQLQKRVELLEGSLQARTLQLEQLLDELRRCTTGRESNPGELLDRLARAHCEAMQRLEAKGQERQAQLRERLAETRQESRRILARLRSDEQRPLAAGAVGLEAGALRVRTSTSTPARKPKRQDEVPTERDRLNKDLLSRVESLEKQLEAERTARLSQETSQLAQPSVTLSTTSVKVCEEVEVQLTSEVEVPERVQHPPQSPAADGERGSEPSEAAGVLPLPPSSGASSARAMRLELEALREEERSVRAAARRRSRAAAAAVAQGTSNSVGPEEEEAPTPMTSSRSSTVPEVSGRDKVARAGVPPVPPLALGRPHDVTSDSVVEPQLPAVEMLKEELRSAQELNRTLQDELRTQQRLTEEAKLSAIEAEAQLLQARRDEAAAGEALEVAEQRIWCLTEALNELALTSDLRHEEALEAQLAVQQKLRAAVVQCIVLKETVGQLQEQ